MDVGDPTYQSLSSRQTSPVKGETRTKPDRLIIISGEKNGASIATADYSTIIHIHS